MPFIIPNQTSTSLLRPVPPPAAWVRPADWITITDAVGEVQFLMSDITSLYTAVATEYTGVGNIYIDWGDGTTTTITSGVLTSSNKLYTSGGTPCSLGYNTWKIRVYGDVGTTLTNVRVVSNSNFYLGATAASGLLEAYYGNGTQQSTWSSLFKGNNNFQPYYTNLTYVKMPETITASISFNEAFYQCYSLRKVVMPISAPNIIDFSSMFYFCNTLTEPIIFPQDNTAATSFNSCFASCYYITSITLPAAIPTSPSFNAVFNSCWSLTSIKLPPMPNCYQFIGTFSFCVSLISIEIPNFIRTGILYNLNSMFQNCSSLEYIKFPSTFPGISASLNGTFSNCHSLKNIVLPSNMVLTDIQSAFQNCYSIASIVMPTATCNASSYQTAFQNCSNLQQITLPETSNASAISFVSAFNNAFSLAQITIPSSYQISSLNGTFQLCRELHTIILPNNAQNSITSMLNMCNTCFALKTITMPTSMNSLATLTGAFTNCNNLQTITLPSSLNAATQLSSVFQNCYNLESITLPTSMTSSSLFSNAFSSCFRLRSVVMPASVGNSAGSYSAMFQNCYSLQNVVLPTTQTTNITNIDFMFNGCGSLTGITNQSFIGNTSTSSTIYVNANNFVQACNVLSLDLSTKFSKFSAYSNSPTTPIRLSSLRLRNNGAGQYAGSAPQVEVSYTNMGQAALVQLFTDLPTITAKTISIVGASGAAALTAPERAIATGKGWTILG